MTTWKMLKEVSSTSLCCNAFKNCNISIIVCARTLEVESDWEEDNFCQGIFLLWFQDKLW